MTDWPDGLHVEPIHEWPGALTTDRRSAQFRSPSKRVDGRQIPAKPIPLAQTLQDLDLELRELGATNVILQVAVPRRQFTVRGKPRADAVPQHPGVILTMDTKHGPLSYPCDTFARWQDNVRAIALALEALRKVDRYGVAKLGDQYRGYLALEPATAMPAGFTSVDGAVKYLREISDEPADTETRALVRRALRHTHPDHGGDAEQFRRVTLAQQYLTQNGELN